MYYVHLFVLLPFYLQYAINTNRQLKDIVSQIQLTDI